MATCDDATNETKKKDAKERGYGAFFATVQVKIDRIDADGSVHFIPTGQAEPVVTQWSEKDVWPECPTEVELVERATGLAMIGDAYERMSPEARRLAGDRKWPDAEPIDFRMRAEVSADERTRRKEQPDPWARWGYTEAQITISTLRVACVLDGATAVTTHDLIAPGLPKRFELDLSQFDSLATILVEGQPREVKMQVIHAYVSGAGVIEVTECDLRDPMLAYPYQVVRIHDGTADVTLSQRGCALFGVAFDL